MSHICVSNTSDRKELEVGKTYELFKHENHPKIVWVKIPDDSNSVGYRTIQCYLSDFKSKVEWRNSLIDEILD